MVPLSVKAQLTTTTAFSCTETINCTMKFVRSAYHHPVVITFIIFLFCQSSFAVTTDLKPVHLRTEYKINPVVDASNPRLSWELTSATRGQIQTAYQIMVASSPALLAADKADLWNSVKQTAGNATNQMEYTGKAL
jgi:alpha-L-rhamnosidase